MVWAETWDPKHRVVEKEMSKMPQLCYICCSIVCGVRDKRKNTSFDIQNISLGTSYLPAE